MENKTTIIYDYVIENNKIKKYEYEVEEDKKSFYRIKNKSNQRLIDKSTFDIVIRNRIVSYEDDFEKFKKILIEYQEEKVEEYKERYEQQLEILKKIKGNQ